MGPYEARELHMDSVFELRAHKVSEIWASLPHIFTKEGLLQLPG